MKLSVILDRVTVTGQVIKTSTALIELQKVLKGSRWEQFSDVEFQLRRFNDNGTAEIVAGLFANPHQPLSWRLDTSNHLQGDELQQILIPISIMTKPHLTRIDVAFDIINGRLPNMAHRIYRFNSSEKIFGKGVTEYTGRSKEIQTIYSGTRKSETQIRYYDKLAEQKSRRKQIIADVDQWERLEIQLRGSSTVNWKTACRKMLSVFKMPKFSDIESPQDRAMLFAIENRVVNWHELGKEKQARLRKLVSAGIGFDDTYSQMMLTYFDEHVDALQKEILGFLRKINLK